MATKASPLTEAAVAPQLAIKKRVLAIDALRGIAMIAMALDHAAASVRNSLLAESYGGQPVVLGKWTQWISGLFTNLATPTFWLLSGVSLAFFEDSRRQRGWSEWAITRYLLARAGVLILLDLTICNWAWAGQVPYLHILTSIGICLAIMSVARLLPIRLLAVSVLTIIFGYQLLLPEIASRYSQTENLPLALLLGYSTNTQPAVEFSIVGWGTLMGLGFVIARGLSRRLLSSWQTWITAGAMLLGAWFALRLAGGLGDLTPFSAFAESKWYYFLVMSKTPPSFTYQAFNLGLAALVLGALFVFEDWLNRPPAKWLVTAGQVALFFFVAHLVVYGILGRLVMASGFPLPGIVRTYLVWTIGLVILIPLAHSYRLLKRRYPSSPLRYL
jgi:uncharacterized membrane protein